MGCCLFAALLAGAPRVAIFLWWFLDPARWSATFHTWRVEPGMVLPSWVVPVLGFVFLPWTTLAWVFVIPGGLTVLDWIILAVALLGDLSTHGGGGRAYRGWRA